MGIVELVGFCGAILAGVIVAAIAIVYFMRRERKQ